MKYSYSLIVIALSGCANLPPPTATVGTGSMQIRLTQISGAVEAGGVFTGGGVEGTGCVLTVLGKLPHGVVTTMQQGTCVVQAAGR